MIFKRVVLLVSLFCVLGTQVVYSQALLAPVENFVVNRAEAAIVTRVAIARGFAANDPRIASTLTAMGESSTALNVVSTGAAIGLGFLGAPVWLTIAASLGILAAGSALVAGGVTLTRSLDGKVITATQPLPVPGGSDYPVGSVPQPAQPAPTAMQDVIGHGVMFQQALIYHTSACQASDSYCTAFPALPSGQKNFTRDYGSVAVVLKSLADVTAYDTYEQSFNSHTGIVNYDGYGNGGYDSLSVNVFFQPNADNTSQTLMESRTNKVWTSTGPQLQTGVQPATWWVAGPGVAPISGSDLSQIWGSLTDNAKSQPLNSMTLAQLVNQTWQQAASRSDYQGLPFPSSQPITSTDVQPWAVANPGLVPNVGDLFRPATDPGSPAVQISPTVEPVSNPITDPASPSNPASNSGTNPAGNGDSAPVCGVNGVVCTMNVNVMGDPGTASPSLETTPTISMILQPIIDLLPDLKGWAVPQHGSVCPKPSFDLFGHTVTMDAQCDLAESNRTAIYGAFLAAFSLAAFFIVLRA